MVIIIYNIIIIIIIIIITTTTNLAIQNIKQFPRSASLGPFRV